MLRPPPAGDAGDATDRGEVDEAGERPTPIP